MKENLIKAQEEELAALKSISCLVKKGRDVFYDGSMEQAVERYGQASKTYSDLQSGVRK